MPASKSLITHQSRDASDFNRSNMVAPANSAIPAWVRCSWDSPLRVVFSWQLPNIAGFYPWRVGGLVLCTYDEGNRAYSDCGSVGRPGQLVGS